MRAVGRYPSASLARTHAPAQRDLAMRGDRLPTLWLRGAAVLLGLSLCAQSGHAVGGPPQGEPPAGPPQEAQPRARTIVADVVVQGNRHIPTQTIVGQLGTRAGQEFQPAVVQEDVRR